jgi:hypothetical protein
MQIRHFGVVHHMYIIPVFLRYVFIDYTTLVYLNSR